MSEFDNKNLKNFLKLSLGTIVPKFDKKMLEDIPRNKSERIHQKNVANFMAYQALNQMFGEVDPKIKREIGCAGKLAQLLHI